MIKVEIEIDEEKAKKIIKDWNENEFTDDLLNFLNDVIGELENQIKVKELIELVSKVEEKEKC